jgi:hypothetical protein
MNERPLTPYQRPIAAGPFFHQQSDQETATESPLAAGQSAVLRARKRGSEPSRSIGTLREQIASAIRVRSADRNKSPQPWRTIPKKT